MVEEIICMFCNKEILPDEESVLSIFGDGTDAHTSCGNTALSKLKKRPC